MDDQLARTIKNIPTLEGLRTLEENARVRNKLTDEVKTAIRARSTMLARAVVAQLTSLPLTNLTPAEEKIVEAISEYVGIQKREGKGAQRTILQVRNRGLIGAAEESVAKSKPTQGYTALADADRGELSYEQIVVDHPEDFSPRALWYSRRTLGLPNDSDKPPAKGGTPTEARTEVLLKWLREKSEANHGRLSNFTNGDSGAALGMSDLRRFGQVLGNIQSRIDFACYRAGLPPLGLTADAPFADAWARQDRTWAFPISNMQAAARSHSWSAADFDRVLREARNLSGQAHISWQKELRENEGRIRDWAFGLKEASEAPALVPEPSAPSVEGEVFEPHSTEAPYWVFVCNPKKWAIDRFLDRRVEHDSWGVRPADRDRFAAGQLEIVRVGVDRRTVAERNGGATLEAGIYALCEVESAAYDGTGASDEFWADGEAREPGWPTIKLKYLRTYLDRPLTIATLRAETPDLSPLLLNGFQAASFPIPADDFREVMTRLGEDPKELVTTSERSDISAEKLAAAELEFLGACPEVKERLSRTIERGPIGGLVKRATNFKCQICDALGHNPLGFVKKNGEHYVEAHHVMPVSGREVGSLSASNVMTLCANHHRQMHYGNIDVVITPEFFEFTIDRTPVIIPRLSLVPARPVAPAESELV